MSTSAGINPPSSTGIPGNSSTPNGYTWCAPPTAPSISPIPGYASRARAAGHAWGPSRYASATGRSTAARIEMAEESWERRVLEQLATEGLREQIRARRWRIFFRFLGFAFLFIALLAVLGVLSERERVCVDRCTAQVEMRGELDADGPLNAENVVAGLQAAFKNKGTQGVV